MCAVVVNPKGEPMDELRRVVAEVLAETTTDMRISEALREKLRQALAAVVKESP